MNAPKVIVLRCLELSLTVDEGSSLHQTAEPRFMGSHIPSKAFRALQTALPSGPPGTHDQPHSSK